MKRIAILTALLLSLLLTACSSPLAGNVEELLEAPKLSQDQTLVVEELNRYIGGSAKLQYPRQGEFLSPFVFKDLMETAFRRRWSFTAGRPRARRASMSRLRFWQNRTTSGGPVE